MCLDFAQTCDDFHHFFKKNVIGKYKWCLLAAHCEVTDLFWLDINKNIFSTLCIIEVMNGVQLWFPSVLSKILSLVDG